MAPHSSMLAWRIPWTEEPGELQSKGLQRAGRDRSSSARTRVLLILASFPSVSVSLCLSLPMSPVLPHMETPVTETVPHLAGTHALCPARRAAVA